MTTGEPLHQNEPQLASRLTTLWGIDVPIIGAPMAGRSGGELAAAVTLGGGLGMFGAGASSSPEWIIDNARTAERIIGAESQRDPRTYGIGLMLWALADHPEQWEAVLEARPKVASLSFGDPAPYVAAAHEAGISVVTSVNDLAQLRQALDADVDAICIQGTDAGGHTGRIGTMPLMQLALDYLEVHAPGIPTAVAGGIGSGRGVAAALAAGADAAWVGTALLASPEATGSAELKAAAVKAGSKHTVLTDIYDRAEQVQWDTEKWPTRTVRNGFVDAYAGLSDSAEVSDAELIAARGEGGDFAGDLKLHAGQGISLLRAELPAAEVVRQLAGEAEKFLERLSNGHLRN
ncbi:NAD(P)H-dependent flavin oxidoreductase [Corynebacterium heidelbergense]|nr:nitronate monooxygenase [Corynebacterium heidelbergense]